MSKPNVDNAVSVLNAATVGQHARGARFVAPACCLALFGIALVVGLYGASHSGPQWPDGPQYANAGAMMRDWYVSRDFLHPMEFAAGNYARYPAFSVPAHPPGYPALLGLWFLAAGMSYASARCFVALCLGATACFFYGILRRQGASWQTAFGGAVLLLTTPEIAKWSRCTMSEVPALAFIMAGSYCFVCWVTTRKSAYVWAAFALAETAFFCRMSAVLLLPGWFLFLAMKRDWRRLFSPHLIASAALCLGGSVLWMAFLAEFGFGRISTVSNQALRFSWTNLGFYPSLLPQMAGWATLILAAVGLALMFRKGFVDIALFWIAWLLSYYVCHCLLLAGFWEQRYFTFALPALCALAIGLLLCQWRFRRLVALSAAVFAAALGSNVIAIRQLPGGVVGYDAVADYVAQLAEPGNVLLSTWDDNDLIFRFHCRNPLSSHTLMRADRCLVVRQNQYVGPVRWVYLPVSPGDNHMEGGKSRQHDGSLPHGVRGPDGTMPRSEVLATPPERVLDLLRRGRVRYLLTCAPVRNAWRLPCRHAAGASDDVVDAAALYFAEAVPGYPGLWQARPARSLSLAFPG